MRALVCLLSVALSVHGVVRVGQFAVDVGDSLPSCQRGNTQACTSSLPQSSLRQQTGRALTRLAAGRSCALEPASPLIVAVPDAFKLGDAALGHVEMGRHSSLAADPLLWQPRIQRRYQAVVSGQPALGSCLRVRRLLRRHARLRVDGALVRREPLCRTDRSAGTLVPALRPDCLRRITAGTSDCSMRAADNLDLSAIATPCASFATLVSSVQCSGSVTSAARYQTDVPTGCAKSDSS